MQVERSLRDSGRRAPDLRLRVESETRDRKGDAVGNAGFGVMEACDPVETRRPRWQIRLAAEQQRQRQNAAQHGGNQTIVKYLRPPQPYRGGGGEFGVAAANPSLGK